MDIKEYRQFWLEQVRSEAEHNSDDPNNEFVVETLETLEEAGELNDPYQYQFNCAGLRGRIMAFDAYGYDDADSAFVLVITEFINKLEPSTLTNSDIDRMYKQMINFIDEAYNGNLSKYCDDANQAIDVAKELKEKIGKNTLDTQVTRFKLFIVTNAVLSTRVKSIKVDDVLERPCELNIWTLERFYQLYISQNSETIVINTKDFGIKGIPVMKVNFENSRGYSSFLGIIEGRFLADIYLKYGSRILEGNVRAFLNATGKVNKGIRKTIVSEKEADQFFTYNNGISTVANNVTLSSDGHNIISFEGLQIINGGQTTASLANAIIKKEDMYLDKIFVPMKLTVLNSHDGLTDEEIDRNNIVIQKISECANTQNPVSEADFFSNHPYHREMEILSAKVLAPPVDGCPYSTQWFYERSRGKWQQEQMKLTKAEIKHFREKSPRKQLIKKEKLAKCLNTLYMNPHQVVKGSARNMKLFSDHINSLWEKSKESINEVYFKKAVCSVIIFDDADNIVNKADWYPTGGNKAQIVPYTIAKIISCIPDKYEIDYARIWKYQRLYPSFAHEIEILSEKVHYWIDNTRQGVIPREYTKKAATWKEFKENFHYCLTDNFIDDLIPSSFSKQEEKAAKKQSLFDNNIEISVQIFNKGAEYWFNIAKTMEQHSICSFGDRLFILQVAKLCANASLLTSRQSSKLKKILDKAIDEGLILES